MAVVDFCYIQSAAPTPLCLRTPPLRCPAREGGGGRGEHVLIEESDCIKTLFITSTVHCTCTFVVTYNICTCTCVLVHVHVHCTRTCRLYLISKTDTPINAHIHCTYTHDAHLKLHCSVRKNGNPHRMKSFIGVVLCK